MNGTSRRILKTVAKSGEISLSNALSLASSNHNNHIDQYPLVLLIHGGYIGLSITNESPRGTEQMLEFDLAVRLHMLTLPKDQKGVAEYYGITSSGSLDPDNLSVFIKAKGALYLDEQTAKWKSILYSFIAGVLAVIVGALFTYWLQGTITESKDTLPRRSQVADSPGLVASVASGAVTVSINLGRVSVGRF